MAKTVSIDVIDKSIPSDNTRNIPIINQPNPCKGYAATAKEVAQLIQLASYYVYAAGTTNVIDGYTFYDYFPEEGGSSSGGGLSRTEIQAMIDASIPTLDTAMSSTSRNGVENRVIKEFVNSSIASSTGTFRGTFDSLDELNAYSGEKKNNDYAYVATKDAAGLSSKQSKYKYVADTDTWTFEYDINNTTFTAAQTAAINSGITDTDVAKITSNETAINELNTKVANHEDTMTKAAAHIIDKKNPHEVTKAQIGLGDVDNTSDMEKPISTLTQAALNKKLDIDSDIVKNSHTHANKEVIDKLSVNDNDELLYNDKKIGADATVVDDALSTTSTNAIANKAVATKINEVEKTITDHVADVENPHNVTKAQIGLDKVDNTADADKPISALTQSALDTKVDKVDGKQLSTNDFTDVEKTQIETNKTDIDILKTSSHTHDNKEVIDKFSADANGKLLYDGAEVGGSSPITVDSELSETSTNPVQNKTITTRINEVENKIPANVSALTNDSEYQTKSDVTTILADYAKTTDIPTVDVTKEYVDTALNGKADVDHTHTTVNGHTVESDVPVDAKFTDTVYDDTAIKELINSKIDETALVDYAKKTDLKTKLSEFENDSEFITNTVDNLTNYYLKTETYTQDEVNNLISNINKITVEVVAELPAENISTSTIYLILIDTEKNVYSQNMYINEKWAVLGSTSVDLTGYVKSDELTTKLEAYATNESVETHTSNNDIHVTTDEKTSWNNAVTASHSHDNKTVLDGITEEKITAYDKAVTDDHTHINKDVIDAITQEDIDKWNSGGSSYTPGQGISISDDSVISTDFTTLSNETSIVNTTKLVSSESKVASLSTIGSLIKEDQSLVTKDELDSRLQKTASSITYGKQYVTNDYSTDAANTTIATLNGMNHSFPYMCPECAYTIYWNDDAFDVTKIASNKTIGIYAVDNSASTPSASYVRMDFNSSYSMDDVLISAPIHYDNYGHLGAIFAYRRISKSDSSTIGAMITAQIAPFKSYLYFKSFSILIKDASWDTSTVQAVIASIDTNITMISSNDSAPYKIFVSFSYSTDSGIVKKSFIYEGNIPSDFTIEYDNATGEFAQSSGTISNIYLDSSVYRSSTYFTPVKFNDVWIMARRSSNSEKTGTPIMYSEDGGKTWKDTTYVKDVPAAYQHIDTSHISYPSLDWAGAYAYCMSQISVVNGIALCSTNDTVVYSTDGKTWHPALYGYKSSQDLEDIDWLGYFTGRTETIFTALSNNRIVYAVDTSEDAYVYSNSYGGGEYVASSSQQSGSYPAYSDDGMVFKIPRFKKSDDTYITQISSSAIVVGPKIGDVLTGHINGYSEYYTGYENNTNKSYLPVYSNDNGETWQVGKMYDTEGNDVTLTDTVDHSLYNYHFYGSDNVIYMLNDRAKTQYQYYTTDGISWKPITLPVESCYITRISYANNMYFATYSNYTSDTIFFYSEDGINFVNTSIDEASSEFYNTSMNRTKFDGYKMSNIVRYVNNKYFIGINYGYACSADGKTWTVKTKNFNNGYTEPDFNTPVYVDGNYVVTFREPTNARIMAYSSDLAKWNVVGCPNEPDYQYMKGIPFMMDDHIAVWSVGGSNGIGVLSNTAHMFDIISTKITKGDPEILHAYAYTYCGYYNETTSRYFIITDNPASSNYPYKLCYSSDGVNFVSTKMTCTEYPHTLYGDHVGGNGRTYFGNCYTESEGQGSSTSSYVKMDYTGISCHDVGGIAMMTNGKCIGFSYKNSGHYSDNMGSYTPSIYKDKMVIDSSGGIYTVTLDGYSYMNLSKYNSSTVGTVNDFVLSSDKSYVVYVSNKGIFYYDITNETLTKASCMDKSSKDITDESVNYRYTMIIGKSIYVFGKPDAVTTNGRYLVSSTLILADDNTLVLTEAKAYTDSKVPKVNIDFTSETSIDVNQTTDVKTGSYTTTSDCFVGCYITETSEAITANAYATMSVDGKPVCSVVNDGTITAGIGNVIRIPKGTAINYTLKSNGVQTATISVFNCI